MKKIIDINGILKSALKEFSKLGYNNASTNKIAKLAGVSKGSLFNYFRSKKNLFEEVLNYSIDLFEKSCSSFEINSNNPEEILKEALIFLKEFYESNNDIYDFYIKAVYSKNTPGRTSIRKVVKIFSTLITKKVIDKFKALGYLKKCSSEDTLIYYINAIVSRIVESHFFEVNSPFTDENKLNSIIKLIIHGIIDGKNGSEIKSNKRIGKK